MLESLRGAAEEVVAKCTAELALVPSSQRTARLHYQIAQACEGVLGDFVAAEHHYQRALAEAPDHVPTIRGARRAVIQLGRFAEALPLFDAELRVTADPKAKALLLYQKGRFLEETLGRARRRAPPTGDALELDLANPTVLKAVERCDRAAGQWRSLARIYERAADAVKGDASHRAALLVKRAQLLETALDDPAAAAEVYALALQLEAGVEEALEALVRICAGRRDWTALIALLARSADRSDDARERTLALYRMARLTSIGWGNRRTPWRPWPARSSPAPASRCCSRSSPACSGKAGTTKGWRSACASWWPPRRRSPTGWPCCTRWGRSTRRRWAARKRPSVATGTRWPSTRPTSPRCRPWESC
jgi:hypothetical protein